MCWLWDDPEFSYEHRTTCNAQRADDHPWREDVSEDESCEECIPQQRDCAKGSKYDDREGGNLEDRAKEVGGDEDAC